MPLGLRGGGSRVGEVRREEFSCGLLVGKEAAARELGLGVWWPSSRAPCLTTRTLVSGHDSWCHAEA